MGNGSEKNDPGESHGEKVRELASAYADALLAGDEVAAEIAIREAMDVNLGTAQIDEEIIAPALWLVGELWQRSQISVADEHVATEITVRVLALQREAQRVARARRNHRVMLAAPAGELHVVALRMVGNLLREAGYDIVMLGADVPEDALVASAKRYKPKLICLSSTMSRREAQILSAIRQVRREWPEVGFIVGGRGLGRGVQLQAQIDVCRRVSEVVEAADALIKRAGLN